MDDSSLSEANRERLRSLMPATDPESTQKLAESLAKNLVVPVGDAGSSLQDYTAHSLTAEAGLASLLSLPPDSLNDAVFLSIVPYTNTCDPWTTKKSAELAARLLTLHLAGDRLVDFIVKHLLQATLRPIFSNSSTGLTASGRPSHFRHQPGSGPRPRLEPPVWKQAGNHIISSFHWAVKASNAKPDVVADHWPLFLPVLLSLAEDDVASVREKGLHIMALFLEKCPVKIMQSTGVDNVFQEAVFPTLLFLPTLTPELDSINLLRPAYHVLIKLAQLDPNPRCPRRLRLLDRLLRDGVLAGYYHASQHIHIVQVLMDCTKTIVSCLGLFAAKHLQSLLRLFSSIMTDPFAMTHPPAIVAAAKALNATVINCWPRFSDAAHTEQVIHIIVLCWLNMRNDTTASQLSCQDSDQISRHLIQTSAVLRSLWDQQGCTPPKKLIHVLEREPQLATLFPGL